MKRYLLLLTLWLFSFHANAQEAIQAYKQEHYNYSYSNNLKLKFNCEMADISLIKSSGNEVHIKCTYSAKHADKSIAEKELGRHNIRVRKTLNEIFISNFFSMQKGENEPKARLNIKFEITIPGNVNLDIENNFGSVKVEGLSIRGHIKQNFGKVDFMRNTTNVELLGKLTEFNLQQTTGILHINNKSGDIHVDQFDGKELSISNSNAEIILNRISILVTTTIEISNGHLTCSNMGYLQRGLNISSYKEPIKAPGLNVETKNNYYTIVKNKTLPQLTVKADYSKIIFN